MGWKKENKPDNSKSKIKIKPAKSKLIEEQGAKSEVTPPPTPPNPEIEYFSISIAGRSGGIDKENNQDMKLEVDHFCDFQDELKLFVVADGHGYNGHHVSQTIKQVLPEYIRMNIM